MENYIITDKNAMDEISKLSYDTTPELIAEIKQRISSNDLKSFFFKILLIGKYGSDFYNTLLN
jgi:hypothetical protein